MRTSSIQALLRGAIVAGFGLALAGCNTIEAHLEPDLPSMPVQAPPVVPQAGAISSPDQGLSLFEDAKARGVGDLLTVTLVEQTQAKKSATTDTSKSDDVSLSKVSLFGKSLPTDSGVTGSRKFAGAGDSPQSNSLTGSITVVVVKRLSGGNLLVHGEKQVQINQGSEYIHLEGVIRVADIAPDNTVTSDRVANARISYTGRGQLADANAQGWLTRFFNSPWMPF